MLASLIACLLVAIPAFALLGDDLDVEPASPVPKDDMTSLVYFFRDETIVNAATPFLAELQSVAMSMNVPDYTGTLKTSVGKIDVSVTDMSITRFDIGEFLVSMNPDDQAIDGTLSDNTFVLQFKYSIKQLSFPYLSETGSGTVSTEGLSLASSVSGTKVESTGGVDMKINYVNFDVGDFRIEVDGGLIGSLINAMEGLFSGLLNDMLSELFSQYVIDFVQPQMDWLKDNILYDCNDEITCIDYRVSKNPLITDGGAYIYLAGTFYNGNHPGEDPELKFVNLPQVSTGKLLLAQYGNASFQSLFNAIQMDNRFNMSSSETKQLELTTIGYDSIMKYYPAWKQTYPTGTNGKLSISVNTAPTSEITVKGIKITLRATFNLEPENQSDSTKISGNVSMVLLGDFWWRWYHYTTDEILNDDDELTIDSKLSSFQLLDGNLDQAWVEDIITNTYLPWLNNFMSEQPMRMFHWEYMRYKNPSITYNGNYVSIESDFIIDM